MQKIDRYLIASLTLGVWLLVVMQATSSKPTYAQAAQESMPHEAVAPLTIHATDIVGLSAFVQQTVRDQQARPQSMPGLDQYIKSIVRSCRISGSVSGNRLTSTNISC